MVARRTSVEKSLLPIPTGFLKNHFFFQLKQIKHGSRLGRSMQLSEFRNWCKILVEITAVWISDFARKMQPRTNKQTKNLEIVQLELIQRLFTGIAVWAVRSKGQLLLVC
jgi:hypothetical protein